MQVEDIKFIFNKQLKAKEVNLYFLLVEGEYKIATKHWAEALDDLLICLDNFIFAGYVDSNEFMPRFIKEPQSIA